MSYNVHLLGISYKSQKLEIVGRITSFSRVLQKCDLLQSPARLYLKSRDLSP
jgi:hypothetical protein